MPVFVMGLAISEVLSLLGIFLFQAFEDFMFVIAVLAVLQYVPMYIKVSDDQ